MPLLVKATSWPAVLDPATTNPKSLPLTSPGFQPADAPMVPAYCQAWPFSEK